MGVTVTPLGFQVPDGNDPVRNGDNVIAANAANAQEVAAALAAQAALNKAAAEATANALAARLGQAEANIQAGNGDGPGLTEDPLNPGTYFMADTSPIQPDPVTPGLYTF